VLSIADFGTPAIVGGKVRVLATTAYNLFTSEMAAIRAGFGDQRRADRRCR
jgi:ABC-type Fe3+ transport system permease subunit